MAQSDEAQDELQQLKKENEMLKEHILNRDNDARQSINLLRQELDKATRDYGMYFRATCELQRQILSMQEDAQSAKQLQQLVCVLGAAPILNILDHFANLVSEIKFIGASIAKAVKYRECDAFDDEIYRAHEAVSGRLGDAYATILANPDTDTKKFDQKYLQVLFQILIVDQLCDFMGAVSTVFQPQAVLCDADQYRPKLAHRRPFHQRKRAESPSFQDFKRSLLQLLAEIFKLGNLVIPDAEKRSKVEGDLEKLFHFGQRLVLAMQVAPNLHWKHFEIGLVACDESLSRNSGEYFEVWERSDAQAWTTIPTVLGTSLPGLKLVKEYGVNGEELVNCIVRPQVVISNALQVASLETLPDPKGDGLAIP